MKQLKPTDLLIDPKKETELIVSSLRETAKKYKRNGAIIAVSGGIDSSVVAALASKAFGKNVFTMSLPENDSEDASLDLAKLLVERFNLEHIVEDIAPALEGLNCYEKRDDAIREVIPDYTSEWKCKIVLPSVLDSDQYRFYSVVARSPEGQEITKRLSAKAYQQVLAASNYKQRVRKMMDYYHADRLNYLVLGTPNRLEYDQGFFVKNGDGSADIKPIAHLYKGQVYQLAEYLDVPKEISERPPTTDTYSLPQSQEEFYFSLPYQKMDICLYAVNNGIEAETVANYLELAPVQIERVFKDIEAKRKVTQYLQAPPILIKDI